MQEEKEPQKTVVSFKIRPELKKSLQKLAKADRRTLSAYIELLLQDHVADREVLTDG
jgi:predicted transcriptional regulator